MPGLNIHFAIGNRYLRKNKIKDKNKFYEGLAMPDLESNSKNSHYSGIQNNNDLVDYLENKVLLNKYLESNNVDSDYKIGEFLHLATDYLFFNKFIDKDYLNKVSYERFRKDLYYSYDIFDSELSDKYQVDFGVLKNRIEDCIKERKKQSGYESKEYYNILSEDKIEEFIEYVANLDLQEYATKIKESGHNVMPN